MPAPSRHLTPQAATPTGSVDQRATEPAGRARDALLRYGPFAVLALWTAVVTGVLARWSVGSRLVFRDETNAVVLGRVITQDLSQIVEGEVARGPERMTSLFAAVAATLSDDPVRQFELLHAFASLCQGLVVIPVWLAARELGMGRWQALAPATIASAGSFGFYGIFTLNTSIGVLTTGFMLWALLRALRRPGVLSDVLVLLTLAATILARFGWAPLVAAFLPAVLATIWFARPAGEGAGAWLKALPLRVLRRHPLIVPIAALLLLIAIVRGPWSLLGGYGGIRLEPDLGVSEVWHNLTRLGSHLAIGMALLPMVLALPVVVRGLVRPADPVEGGFSWLVVGYVVLFSWAYYYSMNEDRYFAVLAAPLILAGALAVFRRPPPLWSVLVSGVLVTWMVVSNYESPRIGPYDYFIYPTERFFGDVLLGKLSIAVPFERGALAVVAVAVAGLGALLLVWLARRPALPRGATIAGAVVSLALLGGMLAYQIGAMEHPARKLIQAAGMTDVPDATLEFVDRAAAGDRAEPLAVDGGMDPDLLAQMPMLQVFNASLGWGLPVGREGVPPDGAQGPSTPVTVDWRTGKVSGGEYAPPILLTFNGRATIGFAGERVAGADVFPWAELHRLDTPLEVDWMVRNDLPDRFAERGRPMQVRVFPDGPSECLSGVIMQHPLTDRRIRYRLSGGARTLTGVANPGTPIEFRVRIPSARPTTLTLHGQAGRLADGNWRGPALVGLDLAPCGG